MCGVSRQAIGNAVKAGKIKMLGDKINLDHRITCEYFYSQTGHNLKQEHIEKPPKKKQRAKSKPRKKTVKKKPAPPPEEKPSSEPPEEITAPIDNSAPYDPDQDVDDSYKLPAGIETLDDITAKNIHLLPLDYIKKLKEYETAMKARQMRDESRGFLIERALVRSFISRLYTIDTNQIKTQEDRLVPELCGVFGKQDGCPESFDARKLIKDDGAELLRSIKRMMDDFLVKLREEKL